MFKIFCVYVAFQVYKQSKHEYRIKFGFALEDNINGNNDNEEDLINNNNFNEDYNNENNNQDEFVLLQRNGIPERGN